MIEIVCPFCNYSGENIYKFPGRCTLLSGPVPHYGCMNCFGLWSIGAYKPRIIEESCNLKELRDLCKNYIALGAAVHIILTLEKFDDNFFNFEIKGKETVLCKGKLDIRI